MSIIRFFSKIKYTTLVLVMVIVTVFSTLALSYLITDEITIVSEDIAKRNFMEKYDDVYQELTRLENFLTRIETIVNRSNSVNDLQQNFNTWISFQPKQLDSLISWQKVSFTQYTDSQASIETLQDTVLSSKNKNKSLAVVKKQSVIVPTSTGYVWRNKLAVVTATKDSLFLGYDIALKDLQRYFANVDSKSINYAYVFNKDGLVLLHPDENLLGKSVFTFSSISPKDTIELTVNNQVPSVVKSEYLQLDVIRYLQPLQLKETSWYIAVSSPKNISEENVTKIRQYTFLIYGISTILLLFVFYFFNERVKKQYKEKERLLKEKNNLIVQNQIAEKESSFLQLQQLKEQINPHFLFNALNSLYMLIDVNKEKSKTFALKLSKLYRYFITPPANNITLVKNELELLKEYIYLQQTRFGKSLEVTILGNVNVVEHKYIPFLALQTLVENAIKHNAATKVKPLLITVHLAEDGIKVVNNYQPIATPQKSNHFGIDYLKNIYAYYNVNNFTNYQKNSQYICHLPYIIIK
ncbi:histidine kinase [Cellulophaga lytica]|uniref:histidine kinase n=1 Tax=Cellulophaga lytica TaxID=979 RepID=UPI0026E22482|nr:histidine kinase [Cellulophaga lytica]MDO6852067.1 histidine kinase [Cellulophaga lytica]